MTPREKQLRAFQEAQRGIPEGMFLPQNNEGVDHSSAFQWMMEHTGDLCHRAACFENDGGGGPAWGLSAFIEKLGKLHRHAQRLLPGGHVYDTPRLQAARNYEFHHKAGIRLCERESGMVVENPEAGCILYQAMLDRAGRRYADAYAVLREQHPPLTWLQERGLSAAIALGQQNWPLYVTILDSLQAAVEKADREGDDALGELYARPVVEDDETCLACGVAPGEVEAPSGAYMLCQGCFEQALAELAAAP